MKDDGRGMGDMSVAEKYAKFFPYIKEAHFGEARPKGEIRFQEPERGE